ncbi:ABC transporter ATP-binding protein [Paenibacillus urinalis]|uniref:ABC transporter ATP-binding protein n=1 Tax=Paenibacillus urinalis TaxID=521520 RepID=A0ABY7X7J5_9BACL|nr:ABC transporter ATP-binding protein [Paenibacillus urinalis]WDH98105.1 ABC transporter ATP-binding protein [Paenibacillus urinalis]WDI01788.1 ABC transporter ATP-binding protein [Paenibacillus urinalis]
MITLSQIRQQMGSFVLDIESLTLHNGLTILVGENGAGKTTLLELLATVSEVQNNGEIHYEGKRAAGYDLLLVRSRMGYVPSSMELYGSLTVYNQLRYFGELKGIYDDAVFRKLLLDFDLEKAAAVKIRKLSSGIVRRIHIAQAMLTNPLFLLLDEPMNGLDAAFRRSIISYLSQSAQHRTVVAASHELQEWDRSADYVLWLDRGRVAFYGSTYEWTQRVTSEVYEGEVSDKELAQIPESCIIARRAIPDGHVVRLFEAGQLNSSFHKVTPGMEDAYFIRKRLQSPRKD